ncbi:MULTISPECIES: hypothetical protein [Paenibacillus]|uniref:Small acid-soluble spore protein P n=1 Tax=Paenibacillus arenosi TaxID=2774142 RepID=A0ABR9B1R1_9BACL|nr:MULTISPECIES: hypothetical protein [Paenibacillus]MBD8500305.1 hypothetical protein [Paenibacillus arenosi]
MTESFKDNKGNKYAHQQNHAHDVIMKNVKHPAQKNPWDGSKRDSSKKG